VEKIDPEKTARQVLDACADCDVCRFLMDTSCLFFPELYRLYDQEMEGRKPITSEELRRLVDLCNFCGQCSCPNIRAGIIEAKTQFIERDGLKFGVRTIEDVERVAKLGGAFPALTNALFRAKTSGSLLKAALGIHPSRRMPRFPQESFLDWARKNNLTIKGGKNSPRKVAEHTYDLGEYLAYLHRKGALATDFRPVPGRLVYYPPCHLREQEIGTPYVDLLKLIPGINLETIQGRFYCCGLGGIMGFKREFHETSVQLGGDLMKKIRELNPERLVTDCLSCRMQFNQLLPVEVVHPVEILRESYSMDS